ncbi:MAG: J domain-containing protein [Byssovorax sp.]
MSDPPACVYSVTTTKRRRFFWCAWWTGAPERAPFRKPDAWSGGARSAEEARRQAEEAAGKPLTCAEPIWARAFIRVQAGLPAWVVREPKRPPPESPPPRESPRRRPAGVPPGSSPLTMLGLGPAATLEEIKRAFRRLALATHPDRGGSAAAFIRVKWAHDEALARRGAGR